MRANFVQITNQPVLEVYNDYKTAVWNVLIQQAELDWLKRLNYWIEIPLAILASSTIAGLTIWETVAGGAIWKILGIATAILAIVKPFMRIPEKIEQRGKMLADYCGLEHSLEKIKKLISQQRKYDDKLRQQYLKVLDKKGEIREKYTGSNYLKSSEATKKHCREKVERRLPPSEFYFPEE